MTSQWAFVIGVLSWRVVLIHADWMGTVVSTFKFLLVGFQWLETYTAFWIISSNQSADASSLLAI